MHLGILTQYYPPEMGAPQARLSHLARAVRARGHDVTVLSALPSYPLGRVYPGYPWYFLREDLDGGPVVRAPIWPSNSARALPRVLSSLSFVGSSLAIGAATLPRLDFLFTQSPPLFLGASGYALSRLKQADWIFNVSDLWPDTGVRLGLASDGPMLRALYRLEAFCYTRAWMVIGQTPGIVADIRRRFPDVNTHHMSNGVDTTLFDPSKRSRELRQQLGVDDKIVAVYAGLHGRAQGLEVVLEAAAQVTAPDLAILLVGDGPDKEALVAEARSRRLANLRFLKPMPHAEIAILLASADIGLITLKPGFHDAVPVKTFEAMGAGLPLAIVHDGDGARLVADADAGLAVPPTDSRALAAALDRLARDPNERARLGANGRRLVERSYSRDAIASTFIGHLERRMDARR